MSCQDLGAPCADPAPKKQAALAPRYPYVCELLGIFTDKEESYVVTSFCTGGDLFNWCDGHPPPGREREKVMGPIVAQIFSAVRWLHEMGIAHRDISRGA